MSRRLLDRCNHTRYLYPGQVIRGDFSRTRVSRRQRGDPGGGLRLRRDHRRAPSEGKRGVADETVTPRWAPYTVDTLYATDETASRRGVDRIASTEHRRRPRRLDRKGREECPRSCELLAAIRTEEYRALISESRHLDGVRMRARSRTVVECVVDLDVDHRSR